MDTPPPSDPSQNSGPAGGPASIPGDATATPIGPLPARPPGLSLLADAGPAPMEEVEAVGGDEEDVVVVSQPERRSSA
eukprot:609125-Alexandrium_andersonii.AAC.1